MKTCPKLLSLAGALAILFLPSTGVAATLVDNYLFNNTLNDSLGGPALVAQGGTTNLTNYSFGANQGLSLSSAALSNTGDYSILLHFSLATTSGYRRLIDFQNRTSDSGLYNLSSNLNFYPLVTGASGAITDNTFVTAVLTRDAASKVVTGYVNGVAQFSFTDSTNLAVFSGPNMYFFEDDLAVPNEASAGIVDHIQIYNGSLTAGQVGGLEGGGGNVPEPASITMLGAGLTVLGAVYARRRKSSAEN